MGGRRCERLRNLKDGELELERRKDFRPVSLARF